MNISKLMYSPLKSKIFSFYKILKHLFTSVHGGGSGLNLNDGFDVKLEIVG